MLEKNDFFLFVVYTKNNEVYEIYRNERLAEQVADSLGGVCVKTSVHDLPKVEHNETDTSKT